jgi:hypothetical protein
MNCRWSENAWVLSGRQTSYRDSHGNVDTAEIRSSVELVTSTSLTPG